MTILTWAGAGCIGIAIVGIFLRSVEFVRVTMPASYGMNPGFGAYESMTLPWWTLGSVGVALLTSWKVGAACFALGIVILGIGAQLLGRVFGRSS